MDTLGIETGFCHFCQYEVETKSYAHQHGGDIWLCDFCAMTSVNDRKDKLLRRLNWGLNHVINRLYLLLDDDS